VASVACPLVEVARRNGLLGDRLLRGLVTVCPSATGLVVLGDG
jgi:hypothetical protein